MEEVREAAILPAPEAPRPGPARLSHRHEDIARWLLENPTRPLKECAQHFGYTQAWLSCIIHSDAFQVRLRRLQEEADAIVVLDVPARLRGVAARAIEGLGDQVEHSLNDGNGVLHRQFLLDTAELTLKSLGYGAPKAPLAPAAAFVQNNLFNLQQPVSPEVLAHARGRLLSVVEVSPALPEASQLPARDERNGGEVLRQASPLPSPSGAEGPETVGADL